jgi:hypothetical protein
MANKGGW